MYKVERQSKTKLQVINDSIVSASVGYKNVYLFGIKLYSKTFNEDFVEVLPEEEKEVSVGFKKSKK